MSAVPAFGTARNGLRIWAPSTRLMKSSQEIGHFHHDQAGAEDRAVGLPAMPVRTCRSVGSAMPALSREQRISPDQTTGPRRLMTSFVRLVFEGALHAVLPGGGGTKRRTRGAARSTGRVEKRHVQVRKVPSVGSSFCPVVACEGSVGSSQRARRVAGVSPLVCDLQDVESG